MSLRPKKNKHIAGKTHSEIQSMNRYKRYRWYKTISLKEKEEAMKTVEVARRSKISASAIERYKDPKERTKLGALKTGDKNPAKRPEVRAKISATVTELWKDPEYIHNLKEAMNRPDVKAKQRIDKMGEKNPNWKKGASFEPYCRFFNEERKEHIRNLYSRTCTICDKSTLQNISKDGKWLGRLDVDHLDENKMQGCDDWEWRLTPLCKSCHSKMTNKEKRILLQLLLLNNKRYQTNFLFGER